MTQAAPLSDAGLTPYHAIQLSREVLLPGSTTVVIGIGGLGHIAVQILAATTFVSAADALAQANLRGQASAPAGVSRLR